MPLLLVCERPGTDEWKSIVFVSISHLPLDIIRANCKIMDANLFFINFGSPLVFLRRKKQHEDDSRKSNIVQKISFNVTTETAFLYSVLSAFIYAKAYECCKSVFLKYYCMSVVGTCILLNIKDWYFIFRSLVFSASTLDLHFILIRQFK